MEGVSVISVGGSPKREMAGVAGHIRKIIAWAKLLGFLVLVVSFLGSCLVISICSLSLRPRPSRLRNLLVRGHCSLLRKALGIRVRSGDHDLSRLRGTLIVANHLSYLDIVVLGSLVPSGFVTSVEMRCAPFLGWICRSAGCIFVERRSRENLLRETAEIADELAADRNVILFPEGTSTNGDTVLRFRRPLFAAAIDVRRPIAAVSLHYRTLDGISITNANRDSVFWYGTMPFLKHFLGVLDFGRIDVTVQLAGTLMPNSLSTPESLAAESHALVSASLKTT